ncbi:MAG: Mrp/NBP35 family ATP-binding protein [Acidimicrobiales bacterium]|jgi:ATP-binding protein involved in chromosome partitioning
MTEQPSPRRAEAGTAGQAADAAVRAAAVRSALQGVVDPELGDSIVDLGMVRGVVVEGETVTVEIALTVAGCPLRNQIRADVERRALGVPGVAHVVVTTGTMSAEERAAVMARARLSAQERSAVTTDLPPTARVLAIASGKGGVGKSSVTVNLAVALADRGCTVGVLDADVWGHSVPRLLGMDGELEARDKKMVPLSLQVGEGVVRVVSMGFLSGEDEAIMWRGLVLNRAVQHFLEDVHWGDLDYLLVDLPPGTGDVQMGLARMLPRTEVLLVTTPPVAAQKVAGRAADMARKGHLRVAGVIENMSAFVCAHGESYALFGEGGGRRLADEIGVPLVGQVPLDPAVSVGGDAGRPVALTDGEAGAAFREIAERILSDVAPLVEMSGCSARMLERVEQALGTVGLS